MKLFMLFLFAVSVWAQENYPDKITLYNESVYECRITSMDSKKINMIYGKNLSEKVIVAAIKKIELEKYGLVYDVEKGFIGDEDLIEEFIEKRNDKIEREKLAKRELEKLERKKKSDTIEVTEEVAEIEEDDIEEPEETVDANFEVEDGSSYKKWSFSAVLVPYYSGIFNSMNRVNYYPQSSYYFPYTYSNSEINMIWMLSFLFKEKINFTFDFNYTSNTEEVRHESHYRSSSGNSDIGSKTISELGVYTINLGVKYYLFEPRINNVNFFFHAGFGKQIASAKEETENLYPSNSSYTNEDNLGEYNEDINSPWLLNFGFGSEYYFNKSLSLTAIVRFVYSDAKGTFKAREINPNSTSSYSTETKISSIQNRIGLGFNFYF